MAKRGDLELCKRRDAVDHIFLLSMSKNFGLKKINSYKPWRDIRNQVQNGVLNICFFFTKSAF
jgi:hypothetical protein